MKISPHVASAPSTLTFVSRPVREDRFSERPFLFAGTLDEPVSLQLARNRGAPLNVDWGVLARVVGVQRDIGQVFVPDIEALNLAVSMLISEEEQELPQLPMALRLKAQALAAGSLNVDDFAIESFENVDVHVLIQRVLRQAYLISSDVLFDFAAKTRKFNERKRAIREHILNPLRDNMAASASGEPVDFPLEEVNENGEVVSKLVGEEGATSGEASANSFLSSEGLVGYERNEALAFRRQGLDIPNVEKMNANDLDEFIGPMLQNLWRTRELKPYPVGDVLDFLERLTPEQRLYVLSKSWIPQSKLPGATQSSIKELVAQAIKQIDWSTVPDDVAARFGAASPNAADLIASQRDAIENVPAEASTSTTSTMQAVATTHEEKKAHLDKWEGELQSLGDDTQLANIDLQNQLQRQQQVLQMMSNISKTLFDTTLSVVRKIDG